MNDAIKTRLQAAALATLLPVAAAGQEVSACMARSGPPPHVVELYTSEGCNSCPPADRWLSTLKGRDDVVALAFHVDYWDRLGWTDRFANPAWTQRQYALAARGGSRFAYTPQVVLDGRDYRGWPRLPAARTTAPVALTMSRDGAGYLLRWQPTGGDAPAALSGYWAVTEDGHRTQVRAGENIGVTLLHDGVVRELLHVDRLPAPSSTLRFLPRAADEISKTAASRRLHFVVTDPASGVPVQAVSLGC